MKKLLLVALLLLPLWPLVSPSASAQEGFSFFTTDFTPEEFAARRAAVYEAIGRDGFAVVQGAPSPVGYVRFRQSNEFYYLCGIEVPHAYLLLDGGSRRATLFLPHRNEGRERGEGKVLSYEDAELVKKLSGLEAVAPLELLAESLGRYARSGATMKLFTPFAPPEGFAVSRDLGYRTNTDIASDPWDGRAPREAHFIELLKSRFPQFEVKDLSPTLDKLRLIKSSCELTLLRKA